MRELGLGIRVFGSGINDSFRVHFLRGPRHLNLTRCFKKNVLGSSRFLLDPVQVNNSNICKIYVNCYITRRIGFVSRTKNTQISSKHKKHPKIKWIPANIQKLKPKILLDILPNEPKISKVLSVYPKFIFFKIWNFILNQNYNWKLETRT